MSRIGFFDDATGELKLVRDAAGYDKAREANGLRTIAVPDAWPDGAYWQASSRSFAIGEDLTVLRPALIAQVKAEAERRKMAILSSGGAKKTEYADKKAEVAFFDSLGGTATAAIAAFDLLPATVKATKFAWAVADAEVFGDTIDKAIDRFRIGIKQSAKVPRIGAIEAKACSALRAASSVTAARAIVANITWP